VRFCGELNFSPIKNFLRRIASYFMFPSATNWMGVHAIESTPW
jgi:hypothetical protein